MKPVRVAVILDEFQLPNWIINILEWIEKDRRFELILIVRNLESQRRRSLLNRLQRHRRRLFSTIAMRAVTRIESALLKKADREFFQIQDIYSRFLAIPKLDVWPEISKSGLVYKVKQEICEQIESYQPDVILRFGFNIIKGRILNSATHGIWSFHHGDNRVNRGGPAGFWEVYFREDASGVTLQRLEEELDGGTVLKRGVYPTQRFWLKNQAFLYRRGNLLLFDTLSELAENGSVKPVDIGINIYSQRLFRHPKTTEFLKYLLKQSSLSSRIALRKLLRISPIWKIGYLKNCGDEIVLWRAKLLEPPRGRFFADPFLVKHDNTDFVFFEDFHFADNRGRISAAKEINGTLQFIGEALNTPYHLSFPFTFRFNGKLYMVPESCENRSINLWECTDFPLGWEKIRDLSTELLAADTMIFEHGERWWMLTNIDRAGDGDCSSELFVFFSDCPISGHWTAHPRNPVLIDSRIARNAGIIRSKEGILRISQRQGFNSYGKGLNIHKVHKLTTSKYEEQLVETHYPLFDIKVIQMHHLDKKDNSVVFDFATFGKKR